MNIRFRKCQFSDVDFIVNLKELCFKWYIDIIYGWDINVQKELTLKELNERLDDMRIIMDDNKDIGITTFYMKDDVYVIGLIIIHPNYQNKGIATKILSDYINKAKNDKKKIIIKTYKDNPAKSLYQRLGFKLYKEDNTHVYLEIDFS